MYTQRAHGARRNAAATATNKRQIRGRTSARVSERSLPRCPQVFSILRLTQRTARRPRGPSRTRARDETRFTPPPSSSPLPPSSLFASLSFSLTFFRDDLRRGRPRKIERAQRESRPTCTSAGYEGKIRGSLEIIEILLVTIRATTLSVFRLNRVRELPPRRARTGRYLFVFASEIFARCLSFFFLLFFLSEESKERRPAAVRSACFPRPDVIGRDRGHTRNRTDTRGDVRYVDSVKPSSL